MMPPLSPQSLASIDPSTGDVLATYEPDDAATVEAALSRSRAAYARWHRTPLEARAAVLRAAADRLDAQRNDLAALATAEMGKRPVEARAEVEKCAWVLRHYADHAAVYLADRPVATEARRSFVSFRPIGAVLAVMPWNFPFWQVFRCVAPALAAGNVCVLKHASNVTGCARAIGAVFDAVAPEGVFEVLTLPSSRLAPVIEDPRIAGVALTGSTPAGRAVAAAAGRALKKIVLELGGSDPYVVLADADLDRAVDVCLRARFQNCGQSCIAAKRFVVVDEIADAFVERLVARMCALRVGPPADPDTDLGPMARTDLRDALHDQVVRSVEAGATLRLGGEVPRGPGAFYPPTLLDGVRPGMPAHDEELFGPVAVVERAEGEAEALTLANATEFGLGAAVFSRELDRATRIARDELEAGACFVNDMVRSDPRLPFGGIRASGYGRELGAFGILEFVNIKTVVVA